MIIIHIINHICHDNANCNAECLKNEPYYIINLKKYGVQIKKYNRKFDDDNAKWDDFSENTYECC